jgi:hypothetical protein
MRNYGGNPLGGLLVVGALTASHRLRRWAGLAAVWICGLGLFFFVIAAALGAHEIVALPLASVGIGAVIGLFWLIATFFAWIVRIIVSDTSKSATRSLKAD